jgi:hypothetical protein
MSDEAGLEKPKAQDLVFVCWRGGDGARVTSSPLEWSPCPGSSRVRLAHAPHMYDDSSRDESLISFSK